MTRILRALIPLLLLVFSRGISAYAQAPSAGYMANDTVVCINNVISFTDTSLQGGSPVVAWAWTFGDGGSSVLQNPTYFYAAGGQYTVTLIVTDNNGLKDTATSVIWVLSARAVQNVVRVCSPATSATISAYSAVGPGVTGTWFTASSAVIASPSDTSTLVTNLVSGSYIFYWVVSDGFCSAADQVTVIVDQPVVANAGPDQQICTTSGTATMAANLPSPGTGQWTTTSSAGITNPSSRNTTITGLTTPGTYTFIWTITNGACLSRDTMQITVSAPLTANAGTDGQSCSNNPVATLSANNPAPGTGAWTTTGSGVIAAPTSSSTSVSGLGAGVNTFIWTVTNGACITRDTVVVTVINIVSANAGTDKQVCTSPGTTTLTGNNPGTGTVTWSAVSAGTVVSPNSQTTAITGLTSPGFYSFVYTITNGICTSRDTVVLIVRAPVTANAGTDQSLCSASATTLTGNSAAPGTGLWSTTGSAVIASPSSASTSVSGLAIGNNTFIWSTTYGACVSRDTVVVRVDSVITPNAGSDQAICATTTATLAGSNPAPGTGAWSTTGSAVIASPALSNSGVSGLSTGNNTFIWTITNGACIRRDTVIIRVDASVTSNAGSDQQICSTTGSVVLSGSNPSPGSGAWSTSSSATIAAPSSSTTTAGGLSTAGSYVFIYTITNGSCISRDTVVITVTQPVTSNAGSDQAYCATASATLAGNTAAPGTGTWTTTGSAIVTSPNSPTSGVTGLANGTNIFVWTITSGACTTRDTVIIRVDVPVTANAGSDQQICATTGNAVLTGNSPAPGTAQWTTSGTAVIATPASASTSVSGLTAAGNYTFIYTIINGSCITRDTVVITVNQAVISNAGADQQVCQSVTSVTLTGSNPAPGTGVWTKTNGGTITSPSSATTTITALTPGVHGFIWTITNGSCVSRDTVFISVSAQIPSNAGLDQNICQGGTTNLSGNIPLPGSGAWTTSSSATISNPSSATSAVGGFSTTGVYSFIWTVTNGACVLRDTVRITVDSLIISNAGADQQLCNTTTTTLNGNSPASGTGVWTTTGSATIASNGSANSTVSNLGSGANTFIWSITNGSCVSRDTVIITVDALVPAAAGADQALCIGQPLTLSANSPSQGSGSWTALNGGAITSPTSATSGVTGITLAGTYSFVWTVTNNSCISRDTVAVVYSELIQANAGSDAQYCAPSSVTLAATAPASGNGVWSALNGGTISNTNDPAAQVTGLNSGLHGFVWTVTNGSCVTADTVYITIDSLVPANAGSDQIICATTGSLLLNASDVSPYAGTWSTPAAGAFADPFAASTTFTGLTTTGTYPFIWMVTNGSCSSSDTLTVSVDSNIVANAGVDQQICETTTTVSLSANAVPGVWTTSGTSVIANPADPATTVSGLSVGLNEFVWTVTNGACTSADTVIIEVFPQVTAASAGADGNACSSTGLILAGNTPVTGTGVWSSSGPAVFADSSNAQTSVSGLIAGNYEFFWTISNGGCSSSDTVNFVIVQSPVANAGSDQYVTSGAVVTLGGMPAAVSGIAPFTYAWSNGILLNDSSIANPVYTATSTQTFILTLTDSTGCTGTDSVTVYLNNPPVAVNDSAVLCMDGTLLAVVTSNDSDADGDSLSISILTPPVTGSAVVTATGVITYTPLNGAAYMDSLSYIVCDNNPAINLCDTAWLFIDVRSLPVLTSVSSGLQCFGDTTGGVNLTAGGISTPFTFLWSDNSVSEDIYGVPAGIYTVTVTDSIGCTSTLTDTIDGPTQALTVSALVQNVACYGDSTASIDLTISGGTPGYQIVWNTAHTIQDLDSLIAGIYTAVITDTNGCSVAYSDTILQPDSALSAILTVTNVQCTTDSNGVVAIAAAGGASGYTYLWNTGATTDTLQQLIPGVYTVTVTDMNGCSVTLTDSVQSLNPSIVLIDSIFHPYCIGGITGSVNVTVSGGTTPFTYNWSNGDTLSAIDSLQAGVYNLTITDSAGCSIVYSAVLNDSSAITITATDTVICVGDIAVLSVASFAGITYQWYLDGGILANDTLAQITATLDGNYTVQATAVCGMFPAGPQSLIVNALPAADAGSDITVTCGEPAIVSATGGSSYSWSPAALCSTYDSSSTAITSSQPVTMTVVVTDLNGCTATDSVFVDIDCDPVVIPDGYSPNSDGVNDFFVITGAERFSSSQLQIFNRWGNLVYEKTYYDNSWNGRSNVSLTPGEELPDGTYYYVYDPGDGSDVFKGFVVIRR